MRVQLIGRCLFVNNCTETLNNRPHNLYRNSVKEIKISLSTTHTAHEISDHPLPYRFDLGKHYMYFHAHFPPSIIFICTCLQLLWIELSRPANFKADSNLQDIGLLYVSSIQLSQKKTIPINAQFGIAVPGLQLKTKINPLLQDRSSVYIFHQNIYHC